MTYYSRPLCEPPPQTFYVPCTDPSPVPLQSERTLIVVGSGLVRDRGTVVPARVKLPVSAAGYLRSTRGLRQIKLKLYRK